MQEWLSTGKVLMVVSINSREINGSKWDLRGEDSLEVTGFLNIFGKKSFISVPQNKLESEVPMDMVFINNS